LTLGLKDIPDDTLLDLFMETLKENIQCMRCILEPTSLEKDFMVAKKVESKNMATRRTPTNTYREHMFLLLTPSTYTLKTSTIG